MKDFIDWQRCERRRERVRNRPEDWKPPTWKEMTAGLSEALRTIEKEYWEGKADTWDYQKLYGENRKAT